MKNSAIQFVGALLMSMLVMGTVHAKEPTRADLFNRCMSDPFDNVATQSKAYCDCFADNFPAFAKQLKEAQKNPDKLSTLSRPLDKCQPLKLRDIQKEGEAIKQQWLTHCSTIMEKSKESCECQGESMKQEHIQFENAHPNMTEEERSKILLSETFAKMNRMTTKCATLDGKGQPTSRTSAPAAVVMPDHLDIKDENGKTVRLPVKIPPQ